MYTLNHNKLRECALTGRAVISQQKNSGANIYKCLPTIHITKSKVVKNIIHTSDGVEMCRCHRVQLRPRLLITYIYKEEGLSTYRLSRII